MKGDKANKLIYSYKKMFDTLQANSDTSSYDLCDASTEDPLVINVIGFGDKYSRLPYNAKMSIYHISFLQNFYNKKCLPMISRIIFKLHKFSVIKKE